jgi:hypothetical protein
MRLNALLRDSDFWCARAEQTRSLAQQIDDPVGGAILLKIAAEYDRPARHAEELAERSEWAEETG